MSLTAAGIWLASATGGTMLWERMRHPHRDIERDVEAAMEAAGLLDRNRAHRAIPWPILRTRKTYEGYTLEMRVPRTRTIADVERAMEPLELALRAKMRVQENGRGKVKLTIYTEPMPTNVPFDEDVLRICRDTWKLPVGVNHEGWFYWDLQRVAHLLFGGVPGSGKTVGARSLIAVAILNHPDDIEVYISDGKACGDYNIFMGLQQLSHDIVYTPDDTTRMLHRVDAIMQERTRQLRKANCDNIDEYNDLYPQRRMKRMLVCVDEMAQLTGVDEAQVLLARIAQLGRSPGIHLLGGTQRPDAKTVDSRIKSLMDAVVAYRVRNHHNSQILLDEPGADKLPAIPGRCIFQTDRSHIVQSPHASTARLQLMFLQHGLRGRKSKDYWTDVGDEGADDQRQRRRSEDGDASWDEEA